MIQPMTYYQDGQLREKLWFDEDTNHIHRLDGPAYQEWSCTGELILEEWWINNVRVNMLNHPFVKSLKNYRLYSKWRRGELNEEEHILVITSI